jgi:hypothetical protein
MSNDNKIDNNQEVNQPITSYKGFDKDFSLSLPIVHHYKRIEMIRKEV